MHASIFVCIVQFAMGYTPNEHPPVMSTPEVDIQQCNPISPLTRMKKPVIGHAKVAGIVAAERRKKKANIFASRFAPDQSADELKTY